MNDTMLIVDKDLTVMCDPSCDLELMAAAVLRACTNAGGNLQRVLEHFKTIKVERAGPTDIPLVIR